MPRPTSSGLPFLHRRNDTGKFNYSRIVAPALAPQVVGVVKVAWSTADHTLAGKATVKISLKTGDETTARARWGQVHAQVEALIAAAVGNLKVAVTPPPATVAEPVVKLIQAQKATIAAQAKHDVLAEHDANWGNSLPLSDLAKGLSQALEHRRLGIPMWPPMREFLDKNFPNDLSPAEIPAAARAFQARVAAMELADGKPTVLDEMEAIVEESVPDPDGGPGAIKWVEVKRIPGELDMRLAENGISLVDEQERRQLSLAVLRAKSAAYRDVEARQAGDPIETPLRPEPLIAPKAVDEDDDPVPTLLGMHALWIKKKRPGRKAIDDNLLYINRFIAMHGDMPVDRIKRKHVRAYRDMLERFPRSLPASLAGKAPAEIVAWADARPDLPKLTPQTVNAKGLGSLSTLLEIAIAEYDLEGNPCSNLKLPVRQGDQIERLSFDIEDMKRLYLESPVFRIPPKISAGGGGAAAFWLPLISQFSGGRLEEIGQLLTSDIKSQDGIEYFDFTTIEDDEEQAGEVAPGKRSGRAKESSGKSLKTASSRRRVPVHRVLIELGFLDYVARRRAKRDKRLFPLLKQYRGRWTKNWSRWWGRYQDKHVSKEPGKVFHSFRHTFVGAMRDAKIWEQFQIALIGHAAEANATRSGGAKGEQTIDRYGNGYSVKALNDEIQKISYAGLDLSQLAAVAKLVD